MNRRGFLKILGGAVAAASFDPERALWTPGARKVFIPAPRNVLIAPELYTYLPMEFGDYVYFLGRERIYIFGGEDS